MNQTHACGLSALLVAMALPSGAVAQKTNKITLIGVVRDFQDSHEDFAVSPLLGGGHVAGNVELLLDHRERPVLASDPGFEVADQWRNSLDRPIAPSQFVEMDEGVVRLRTNPVFENSADIDSYEHDLGSYDAQNPGPYPVFVTDQTMPEIPTPENVPASEGAFLRDGSGLTEITSDRHFSSFTIRNAHTVRIVGDVTIVVDGDFIKYQKTSIELAPDSSLTLYIGGRFSMRNSTNFNAGGDPADAQIYKLGTGEILVEQTATICANLVAPWAKMQVSNYSDYFGTFDGAGLLVDNNAGFHVDGHPPVDACGVLIKDRRGVEGMESRGDISSASTFSQWFRDREGINASKRHAITLHKAGKDFFAYSKQSFFPIDEQLYGNEGRSHNLHFTYEISAHFVYNSCAGQMVELAGSDDIWVYVDDQLLIDLGGIGADQAQVGEMDRLNLVDGQTYTLRIFYAHRSFSHPSFSLRTNILLNSGLLSLEVPVSPFWD